jgi:hypothetical protein
MGLCRREVSRAVNSEQLTVDGRGCLDVGVAPFVWEVGLVLGWVGEVTNGGCEAGVGESGRVADADGG